MPHQSPDREYSGRDIVDKLGVKSGYTIAFFEDAWPIDAELRSRILMRAGQPPDSGQIFDLVFATVDPGTDPAALLRQWKRRLDPTGGIWVLSRKRGQSGYVNQNELIVAGARAGMVDNKVCSVSDTVSAMRFVIRREERSPARVEQDVPIS